MGVRRSTTPVEHRAIWLAATRYVDANLGAALTVAEVAAVAITSPRQLQRVFAGEGDTTLRAYVVRARMRRASELLLRSDAPLDAIAAAVGYAHVPAFVKAFRIHYGMPPITFRRVRPRRR